MSASSLRWPGWPRPLRSTQDEPRVVASLSGHHYATSSHHSTMPLHEARPPLQRPHWRCPHRVEPRDAGSEQRDHGSGHESLESTAIGSYHGGSHHGSSTSKQPQKHERVEGTPPPPAAVLASAWAFSGPLRRRRGKGGVGRGWRHRAVEVRPIHRRGDTDGVLFFLSICDLLSIYPFYIRNNN